MSFASEAAKLLTNQYFLYFIVFLAVTNVMGYLVTNKINAVAFFILVCILMYNFSKNMTVVLIVAIVATNLLMVNKSMREGMENETDVSTTDTTATDGTTTDTTATDTTATDDVTATTSTTSTKPTLAQKAKTEKQTLGTVTPNTKTQIKTAVNSAVTEKKAATPTTDTTTTDTTTTVDENGETVPVETFAPAGAGFSGNKRGAIGGPMKASRIDYSTTLEQAYENLDKMIGGDGLQNLSADTERLMNQQQKLFGAVEKMLPMIDKAQGMIQGLDMTKINSLIGMTDKIGGISGNLGNGINKLMGAPVGN
jgi:hypothetical protein